MSVGEEKDVLERISAMEVQIKGLVEIKAKLDGLYNLIVEMKLVSANAKSNYATKAECQTCRKTFEDRMDEIEEGRKKLFWAAVILTMPDVHVEPPKPVEQPVDTPVQQPEPTPEPEQPAPVVEELKPEAVVKEAPKLPTWLETVVKLVLRFITQLLKKLGGRKYWTCINCYFKLYKR